MEDRVFPHNTNYIDNYPSISGTTDCVDGHGMAELREILSRQLDVACLTVLEGAFDIPVYNQKNGLSKTYWHGAQ